MNENNLKNKDIDFIIYVYFFYLFLFLTELIKKFFSFI